VVRRKAEVKPLNTWTKVAYSAPVDPKKDETRPENIPGFAESLHLLLEKLRRNHVCANHILVDSRRHAHGCSHGRHGRHVHHVGSVNGLRRWWR